MRQLAWDHERPVFAASARYAEGLEDSDCDAIDLTQVMRRLHGYGRGSSLTNLRSQWQFSSAFNEFLATLSPEDQPLIYVSSHAQLRRDQLRLSFEDFAEAGGYAFDRLLDGLRERGVESALFILDCCHAAAAGNVIEALVESGSEAKASRTSEELKRVPLPKGYTLIAACGDGPNDLAHYDPTKGMSRFTEQLLASLRGGSGEVESDLLTAAQIVETVNSRLEGQQAAVFGLGEMPVAMNRRSDDLPLGRYRAAAAEAHAYLPSVFGPEGATIDEIHVDLDLHCEGSSEKTSDATGQGVWTLESLMSARSSDCQGQRCWQVEGIAGSGKTTLARNLTRRASTEPGWRSTVVYVRLPEFVSSLNEHQGGPFPPLFQHVARELTSLPEERDRIAAALAKINAKKSGLWLLLDGLDELRDAHALERAEAEIRRISRDFRGARIAVLSRPREALLPGFRRARIASLAPKQRCEILERWLPLDEATSLAKAIDEDRGLQALTDTPLMLSILAAIQVAACREGSPRALPKTKTELLQRGLTTLLRGSHRGEDHPHLDARRWLLAELSLELQDEEEQNWECEAIQEALPRALRREVDVLDTKAKGQGFLENLWENQPSTFLDDVHKTSGVLGPYDGSQHRWAFLHRQLREFLSAEALMRHPEADVRNRTRLLSEAEIARWEQVIGFYCSRQKSRPPLSVLESLREAESRVKDMRAAKTLAILPHVERCSLADALEFMLDCPGWTGDDIEEILRVRIDGADARRDGVRVLWAAVAERHRSKAGHHIDELGHLLYGLDCIADSGMNRERFFRRCGLWPETGRPEDQLGLEYLTIPAGRFAMGSADSDLSGSDDERPQHPVELESFELGSIPVCEGQLARLTGIEPQSETQLPAANVSWWTAYLFARWVGARLPTEAQWEYACRGSNDDRKKPTRFWSGDADDDLSTCAWYSENSQDRLHSVGHPPQSRTDHPWGLQDLHGNVWEWCMDRSASYELTPREGDGLRTDGRSRTRILRGGSFGSPASDCRSANRYRDWPGYGQGHIGFRLARPTGAADD